jgi:hypothetical protein
MLFGGTNWGNLGFPYGYTSYDYGGAIRENRTLFREKYHELKLQANFFRVSPEYLLATPQRGMNGTYANITEITVTPLMTNMTNFYVVRHANYSTLASTSYSINMATSMGNVTVPRLGGALSLNGRDSKILVTDYKIGTFELLY